MLLSSVPTLGLMEVSAPVGVGNWFFELCSVSAPAGEACTSPFGTRPAGVSFEPTVISLPNPGAGPGTPTSGILGNTGSSADCIVSADTV